MTGTETGLHRLAPTARLLVTHDGTVTELLGHLVGEPIANGWLHQCTVPASADVDGLLEAVVDEPLLDRSTALVGRHSGTTYVRARSLIRTTKLAPALREDLLLAEAPIGALLRRHRVESFRELVDWSAPESTADVRRRYVVHIDRRPALLIEESFALSVVIDHIGLAHVPHA